METPLIPAHTDRTPPTDPGGLGVGLWIVYTSESLGLHGVINVTQQHALGLDKEGGVMAVSGGHSAILCFCFVFNNMLIFALHNTVSI